MQRCSHTHLSRPPRCQGKRQRTKGAHLSIKTVFATSFGLQSAGWRPFRTPEGGPTCTIDGWAMHGMKGTSVLVMEPEGYRTVTEMTSPCEKSTSSDTIRCRASGASGAAEE